MGAWGLGLFQSDYNYDVIDELTNESGLRLNTIAMGGPAVEDRCVVYW